MSEDWAAERLERMREVGIRIVRVLGPGNGRECLACRTQQKRGCIPIAEAPTLPITGCSCRLGCRCVVIAEG